MESLVLTFTLLLTVTSDYVISSQEASLVGCFVTTFAVNSKYDNAVKPLTWEMCIRLCATKMTRFAGVQSSINVCYCGNDIEEYSARMDHTSCRTCPEDPQRQCGGDNTLSLYLLTDYESEVFLAATPAGVMFVKKNTTTLIPGLTQNAITVDYHYKRNEIFYIFKNKILRSSYIPFTMRFHAPTTIIEDENSLTDLAVDWVNDWLYYSCKKAQTVKESNLDGSAIRNKISNLAENDDMAYDPYTRMIYSKFTNQLLSYNFKSFNTSILGKYKITKILEIAVDIHQETIYVIGSYDSDWHLVSIDYEFKLFRVIYSGPELTNPFGLDVLNDRVVWGNYKDDFYRLYSARISQQGMVVNLTTVYQGTQKINKIKIYHPEVQAPSLKYSCKKKDCSHTCTPVTYFYVRCDCPNDMTLDYDDKTCIDIPTSTELISTTLVQDRTEYSNPGESISSTEDTFPSEYWSTSAETSPDDAPSSYLSFTTTMDTPVIKKSVPESKPGHYMTVSIPLVCDLVIIGFLLVLLCLVIRQQRQIRNFTLYYNKSSELAELTYDI